MNLDDLLLSTVLETLREGVYIVNENWKIVLMNSAAEQLTGYTREDWSGRFCRNVFRTDRCDDNCPLCLTLERGAPVRDVRVTITRADGRPLEVLMNTSELRNAAGSSIGGVIVFHAADSARRDAQANDQGQFEGLIGRDRSMQEVFDLIEHVAGLDSTVLITGESGTGKELVANAIVARSKRQLKPFVKVNCSVFAETLLESELFGHVRGAFTGALADRLGRFELAAGGTILLDEIGDAPLSVQLKLLRVLQEREFERVGGTQTVKIDVRVIAATNRDLRQLIEQGRFREDLFYRLSAVPIELPPLRLRGNDVLLLVEHLFEKLKVKTSYSAARLSDEAFDSLSRYSWPGNIRQLENALEYSVIRAHGDVVLINHLPPEIREPAIAQIEPAPHAEKARLLRVLRDAQWNRAKASTMLGISRTTLWRLMKRHKLDAS